MSRFYFGFVIFPELTSALKGSPIFRFNALSRRSWSVPVFIFPASDPLAVSNDLYPDPILLSTVGNCTADFVFDWLFQ